MFPFLSTMFLVCVILLLYMIIWKQILKLLLRILLLSRMCLTNVLALNMWLNLTWITAYAHLVKPHLLSNYNISVFLTSTKVIHGPSMVKGQFKAFDPMTASKIAITCESCYHLRTRSDNRPFRQFLKCHKIT